MLGRMLSRMGSPEELQAEACKQMDVDWCLFFFFLDDIHREPEKR